ncbi:hypothetical protein ACLKMH_16455 [Psychromonas sp. KJ10-10]|uniref:hypothetical protein n=1 Tax=Psychromonas sp. KJ10-10 TaxID=3391823 RepID=UPI0039B51611
MYRSVNNPLSSDVLIDGKPSPFATSARSVMDELNLEETHFNIEDISCLGYFMDLKRAQPFFLFYLKVDLTLEDFSLFIPTVVLIFMKMKLFLLYQKTLQVLKGYLTGKS